MTTCCASTDRCWCFWAWPADPTSLRWRQQRPLQSGMAEIVADEQQRHLQPFRQRIGKAIAEVQAAGMAPLSETREGQGSLIGPAPAADRADAARSRSYELLDRSFGRSQGRLRRQSQLCSRPALSSDRAAISSSSARSSRAADTGAAVVMTRVRLWERHHLKRNTGSRATSRAMAQKNT